MSLYLGTNLISGTQDISGKADIDAGNFNAAGKSLISGLGMPSNTYIDYNTSNRSFTAPANGYYNAIASMGTNSNLRWENTSNGMIVNYMNSQVDTRDMGVCIPVKKGDSLTLIANNVSSVKKIRFIYAEGEI